VRTGFATWKGREGKGRGGDRVRERKGLRFKSGKRDWLRREKGKGGRKTDEF
jgi:hypothetical protein